MMLLRLSMVALAAVLASSAVSDAQTRRAAMLPAETPPDDFDGSQYVDSTGCAFVRAALNGQTTWLPLFGDDRQAVCGLEPTRIAGPLPPGRVIVRPPAPAVPRAAETAPELPVVRNETAATEPTQDPGVEATTPDIAESPIVIAAAGRPETAIGYTLRVIERRGTIIEVHPDPDARSPLTVIERRGSLFYPDA